MRVLSTATVTKLQDSEPDIHTCMIREHYPTTKYSSYIIYSSQICTNRNNPYVYTYMHTLSQGAIVNSHRCHQVSPLSLTLGK